VLQQRTHIGVAGLDGPTGLRIDPDRAQTGRRTDCRQSHRFAPIHVTPLSLQ
jgi:hypothetical protein